MEASFVKSHSKHSTPTLRSEACAALRGTSAGPAAFRGGHACGVIWEALFRTASVAALCTWHTFSIECHDQGAVQATGGILLLSDTPETGSCILEVRQGRQRNQSAVLPASDTRPPCTISTILTPSKRHKAQEQSRKTTARVLWGCPESVSLAKVTAGSDFEEDPFASTLYPGERK